MTQFEKPLFERKLAKIDIVSITLNKIIIGAII